MFDEFFDYIDNDSFLEFSKTSQIALMNIASNPKLMCEMLDHIEEDHVLTEKSECYDFLDKMVIYSNDDKGIYARISLFHEGYGERIHYHRWNYASYILHGGYTQSIYGNIIYEDDVSHVNKENILLKEKLGKGNVCMLHHTVIHSIQAEPQTVSLCIRGKALCNRFQVKDPSTGTVWWQYGSKLEAYEERAMKRISNIVLHDKIEEIKKLINGSASIYV